MAAVPAVRSILFPRTAMIRESSCRVRARLCSGLHEKKCSRTRDRDAPSPLGSCIHNFENQTPITAAETAVIYQIGVGLLRQALGTDSTPSNREGRSCGVSSTRSDSVYSRQDPCIGMFHST